MFVTLKHKNLKYIFKNIKEKIETQFTVKDNIQSSASVFLALYVYKKIYFTFQNFVEIKKKLFNALLDIYTYDDVYSRNGHVRRN